MKTEFTPGPWIAKGRYIGAKNHMSSIGECRDVNGNWSDDARAHANANLIAAAPDLYAALERIAHLHRDDMCLCQPINRVCAPCQAKNALAKARGEQP